MSSIAINRQPVDERTWISMIRTDRPIRWLTLFGAVIAALYLVLRPTGDAGTLISNALFTVVSGGAGILCLRTARMLDRDGIPWRFFGVGCIAWFFGQMVWNW